MAASTSVRRRCEPDCTCGRHYLRTPEVIAKFQAKTLGHPRYPGSGRRPRPDDEVTYNSVHKRLRKERGTPSRCEHCGSTTAKKFEWAYTGPGHAERRFAFSADLDQYIRLCTSCHLIYDNGRR